MTDTLLTNILKLQLTGLPQAFSVIELQECAEGLIADLRSLLDIDAVLHHTKLEYRFQIDVNDKGHPSAYLLIGLELRPQTVLNFGIRSVTLGTVQAQVLEDRQRLINNCNNIPLQSSVVVNSLANRINAASLDLPVEQMRQDIATRLGVLLRVKQQHWIGTISDSPFQHELPTLPRYEWQREVHGVRVMLHREKRGYSLQFLEHPAFAISKKRLLMAERPADRLATETLERAEFNRDPIQIEIRVGTRPGSSNIVAAAFVSFST